jgi:UDP-N-acetylglucosamine 1-carboxyvinyltransferase
MLEVMTHFGARWTFPSATDLHVTCPRLRPADVDIARWSLDHRRPEGPYVSGATKTALLMAAAADGTSIIYNPLAREAEHELIAMLRRLGTDIEQRDGCWIVRGGRFGGHARYRLMPDPADLITWQAICVLTGSSLVLRCEETARVGAALRPERRFLAELGVVPRFGKEHVQLTPGTRPFPGVTLVAESAGVSTDAAPLLAVMLLRGTSPSIVTDRVWRTRFGYAKHLNRLNARCQINDDSLVIHPSVLQPSGQPLTPADTRSGAACLVAALAVPGQTTITGVEHLRRGYELLVDRLRSVGASVAVREFAPCTV